MARRRRKRSRSKRQRGTGDFFSHWIERLEQLGWTPGFPLAKRLLLAGMCFGLPLVLLHENTGYEKTKIYFALAWITTIGLVWAAEMVQALRRGRTVTANRTGWFLPIAAMLAAILLSLVNTDSLRLSIEHAVLFVYFAFFTVFVANTLVRRVDLHLALGSLLAAAVIAALYGLLQYYGIVPGHPNPRVRAELMISTLGNKNYLGGYLAYLLFPALGLLLSAHHKATKVFALLGLAVAVATLTAVSQEAAYLALLAGGLAWVLGILTLKLASVLRAQRVWVFCLAGACLVAVLFIAAPAPWNSVRGVSQDDASPTAGTTYSSFGLQGDWNGNGSRQYGIYHPDRGRFALSDQPNHKEVRFGPRGGWPIVGDWDGDRSDDLGVFANGTFHIQATVETSVKAIRIKLGTAGDRPVNGDWNGDGLGDIGVYQPDRQRFLLMSDWTQSEPSTVDATYGSPADLPVAWTPNGAQRSGVGLFRPESGKLLLDVNRDGQLDETIRLSGVEPDDLPVISGPTTASPVGFYRPATRAFLRDTNDDALYEVTEQWGSALWHQRIYRLILRPSLAIRLQDWLVGWEMFADHPLVGSGLANYRLQYLPYKAQVLQTDWGQRLEQIEDDPTVGYIGRATVAHNEYVQIASEMGFLGLLALGGFLAALVRLTIRGLRSSKSPMRNLIVLSAFAGLVVGLAHAIFSFPFHLPASALVLSVLAGILGSSYLHGQTFDMTLSRRGIWTWAGIIVLIALLVVPVSARDFVGDLYLDRGQRLIEAGYSREGVEWIQRSMALSWIPGIALIDLGTYYGFTGQWQKCIDAYERASTLELTEINYLHWGACHFQLGEYEQALRRYRTLAAIDPHDRNRSKLLDSLSRIYRKTVEAWNPESPSEKTIRVLDDLVSVSEAGDLDWPHLREAHITRVQYRIESGEAGGIERALAILRTWVQRHPADAHSHLLLGKHANRSSASRYLDRAEALARRDIAILKRFSTGSKQEQQRIEDQISTLEDILQEADK